MARAIGRYLLHEEIAHGGMATVHLGTLRGSAGFSRTVAIKQLHPQFARDPDFVAMFLDEAHLAARIRHANVVSTLDVIADGDTLLLVMEYVQGESLSRILKQERRIPPAIAAAIVVGVLNGLHAAHEARDDRGEPLHVVHRDVSPHNIIVGVDGITRVLDFGVAKAVGRLQTTRDGQLKGKLAYMAPEQFRNETISCAVDIRAAGLVLFEALTGERMISGATDAAVVERVLYGTFTPPSEIVDVPLPLDAIVERAVADDPAQRFPTAREMATAIEAAVDVASVRDVADWVQRIARETLEARTKMIAVIERSTSDTLVGSVAAEPLVATRSRRWIALPIALAVAASVAAVVLMRKPDPVPAAAPAPSAIVSVSQEPAPPPPPIASASVSVAPKKIVVAPIKKKPAASASGKSLLPSGLPDDRN